MSQTLTLANIRSSLIRQEDTIIFQLIERAQYGRNAPVYVSEGVPVPGRSTARSGEEWPLGLAGASRALHWLGARSGVLRSRGRAGRCSAGAYPNRVPARRPPPAPPYGPAPALPGYDRNGRRYSLLEYVLRQTEQLHGAVRRYTSPTEHPFFPGAQRFPSLRAGPPTRGAASSCVVVP
jgi:hypothetical protein